MRQAVFKTMTSLAVIAVIGSVFVSDASAARRRRSSNGNSQCTAQDAARIRSHSIAHIESKVRAYSVECDRIVNYYLPRIQHALRYGDRRRAQHYYDEAVYRLQRKYHETCSYIHNYGAHYGDHLARHGYREYGNHVRYAAEQGCRQVRSKLGHGLGALQSS